MELDYQPFTRSFLYPRPGSNRHAFKGQGILSPSCLPIPPLRHLHKKSRFHSGPCGAENETRTRDPDLGKVVLYQLSYFRFSSKSEILVCDSAMSSKLAIALAAPRIPSFFESRGFRSRLGKTKVNFAFALAASEAPLAKCGAKIQLFSYTQLFF